MPLYSHPELRMGQNRGVVRACFEDRLKRLVGQALFIEYEDVLGRKALFKKAPLMLASVCGSSRRS
ncbi:MAG: hypothetical protein HYR60_25205 [Acidobacteria bacterium]|nr:hypothetical protein [Acidobacteriota bacterium]